MNEKEIRQQYHQIVEILIKRKLTISTMESCTGGMLASLLTDTQGASAIFPGGMVTYSNSAKIIAGVSEEIIRENGVYSMQTAEAMARKCQEIYGTDLGVGVTGSLGNTDPRNADSVPGEVYVAIVGDGIIRKKLVLSAQSSRHLYKMQVAGEIAELLKHVLDSGFFAEHASGCN